MRDLRGLVGWPGGVHGWAGRGGTVEGEEAWAVVLLGLGLLLGLFWGCLHLGQRGQSRVRLLDAPPRLQTIPSGGKGGVPHLVGLGLAVLRVVLLVCLCLSVLLCLLGLLVLLLIVHRLFFLWGDRTPLPSASWRRAVTLWMGGGSLTFAAFLAFGSGLGWGGFYDNNGKESSIYCTSTSLRNNRQFSCLHPIIGIIATFSPV